MEFPFPTQTAKVFTQGRTKECVRQCVIDSVWFCVMPLPDDHWAITTKAGEMPAFVINSCECDD
jgi:hypothetical protein